MEKSFIWAKLRNKVWGTASQITLRNRSKGTWFSVQFDVRTKNIKQSRDAFLQGFKKKKKKNPHIHSESVWTWHLGGESYHQQNASIDVPGREAFTLYFWRGHPLLPVSMLFSLIIKQMCSVCLIGHQPAVLLAWNTGQLIYKAEDFPKPPCVNIYQLDKFPQSSSDKQMSLFFSCVMCGRSRCSQV